MKHFKHIEIIENKSKYKLMKTSNEGNDFIISFILKDNKIYTSFDKDFILSDMTFIEKIKTCFKILFNKKIKLSSTFKFKNGEHVVDISDTLYLYSREIQRK